MKMNAIAARKIKTAEIKAMRLPRGARLAVFTTVMAMLLVLGNVAGNMAYARGAPDSFADLAERLLPSVVNIKAVQTASEGVAQNQGGEFQNPFPPGNPFGELFEQFRNRGGEAPQQRPRQSAGSGFVIDAKGYIVTNHHVIDGADEVYVLFNESKEEIKAEVLGTDPGADLAVLKIDVSKKLTPVPFGDSDKARIGDWVVAIGNPWGLGGTVTAGIISARSRDIDRASFVDYIQTDAPINQGNSGGPLFNMDGEVVGINTAIYSRTGGSIGLGFAIPSNSAIKIVKQLQDGGKVRRGWLGVGIQDVDDGIAEGIGMDEARGALVSSVFDGSPASDAGVKDGDVILNFNGNEIADATELRRVVASTDVGKKVKVDVWRKGKVKTLKITLGERNETELASLGQAPEVSPKKSTERLGMTLSGITDEDRTGLNIPEDIEGVLVKEVAGGSEAAEKQVRPGMVIVADASDQIRNVDDLDESIDLAKKEGRKSILLHVWQEGNLRFIALKINGK